MGLNFIQNLVSEAGWCWEFARELSSSEHQIAFPIIPLHIPNLIGPSWASAPERLRAMVEGALQVKIEAHGQSCVWSSSVVAEQGSGVLA